MKTFPALFLLLGLFPCLLPAQDSATPPFAFDSIGEVVSGWKPDRHLWVKGSVNLPPDRLAELETWLDENAPNWTVVLMENASGQETASEKGMSAVESALGPGLSNRTSFSELKDSRTGEPNGAVFILFLEERKFSYFASETFDKRGLGEDHWIGKLDRPAVAAMRSGGNIVGAVQNTVTSIEKAFDEKIKAEEEAMRSAEIEQQRAIEEVKRLPSVLETGIREATYLASKLRADNPDLSGPLVRPETAVWLSNVEAIKDFAEAGEVEKARELGENTKTALAEFHQSLTDWEDHKNRFVQLRQKLDTFPRPAEAPSLLGQLAKADESLASARKNHRIGEPLYAKQLEECESAMDQANAEWQNWKRLEEEKEREAKAAVLRNRILIGVAILLLLVGLALANRGTRPFNEEATKLFRKRRRDLRGKFDQLFTLMDRAAVVVGPDSRLSTRGFSGTTYDLAKKSVREIDELFIMSAATDSVMEKAEKLIQPKSVFAMLENVFSPRKYKRAIALLGSKPIGFDRDDNLEAILGENVKEGDAGRSLLGKAENYQPFRISFEKLIAEFDDRRKEAEKKIDRLEQGIDGLPLLQERVSEELAELAARTEQQGQAASEDGWFPLLSLRNRLIPAANSNLNEAAETGQEDPVTAFETVGKKVERQVGEGLAIANRIESVRHIDFPVVKNAVERLEAQGRNAAWVDTAYDEYTGFIEQLAIVAIGRSIADDWKEFEDDIFAFKGRVTNCAALAQKMDKELESTIEARVKRIDEVRGEIGKALDMPEDQILCETNLSPNERIRLARQEMAAATASLDHGNHVAAQENFHEIELTLREVDDLLRISLDSLGHQKEKIAELQARRKTLSGEASKVVDLFNEMEDDYDPAVMYFATRFGESVRGQQSIRESINRARSRLDLADEALSASESAFEKAALIESSSLLEKAANELNFVEHQVGMIKDQHQALKKAEKKNIAAIPGLVERHGDLNPQVARRETILRTVEQHRFVGESLGAFQKIVTEGQKDPFTLFHALAEAGAELDLISDSIKADLQQFKRAGSAVARARASVHSSLEFSEQAKHDKITDSVALSRALRHHAEIDENLTKLETLLEGEHLDWGDIFEDANSLSSEALKTRSIIRDEVKAAREAASKLEVASAAISALQGWRSSHSVKVKRKTGNKDLLQAQHLLEKGDYSGARQAAIASHGAALREKKRVESREAEKRRAAQASRRQSLSSSFSSGSSFSSSSRSSSGFSSSSFSSSSSGFSRSGW